MKRLNLILVLLTTFLTFTMLSNLSAQPRKGFGARQNIQNHRMMAQGLNLTDEQESKIADLRLAFQKEILPYRTELQGKRAELRLLETEANPNLNRIDQTIEQAEKIRTKIQKARARHQLEIRKILTPEQQKLWDSRTLQGRGQRMMGRKFRDMPDQF
jgi:Spy/CpxP family protein refolding chaperone